MLFLKFSLIAIILLSGVIPVQENKRLQFAIDSVLYIALILFAVALVAMLAELPTSLP
jgi:hypothetical protein